MTAATRPRRTATRKPMTDAERDAAKAKRQEEASELHRAIANKVKTLAEGDEWINYLTFMRSFHTYSFNNVMLMMVDRMVAGQPMPTLVAGYNQWLYDKGYQVRKGEAGMRIFGFSKKILRDDDGNPVIDEQTGKPKYRVLFPIVSVFDVAQVEPITESYVHPRTGKTVPAAQPLDAHQPTLLTGEDTLGIRDRVAEFVHGRGWTFNVEPNEPGGMSTANGYTTTDGSKRVVVRAELEPAQQAKTALHEAAHMLMHVAQEGHPLAELKEMTRATAELEAESVAYVVGAMLGLDTEQYSDKYLLHWASRTEGTPSEVIKATADRVQRTVRTLVDALGGDE